MIPPYRSRPRSAEGDGHELDDDELQAIRFHGLDRCGMCEQLPSPGRTCQRCETPLHELWPACYCSNECAYEDA